MNITNLTCVQLCYVMMSTLNSALKDSNTHRITKIRIKIYYEHLMQAITPWSALGNTIMYVLLKTRNLTSSASTNFLRTILHGIRKFHKNITTTFQSQKKNYNDS